jgi:pimeloyl-ACP methyl ester carboxylesterase
MRKDDEMESRLQQTPLQPATQCVPTASVSVGAERAAGIDYAFVERPAGVQADFVAPPHVRLRFLAISALDGVRVDAALAQPDSEVSARATVLVSVHGSGERYDAGVNGFLARALAARGYAVLAINTRQSGAQINTDNFFDVRRDLEAAVYTARALGYRSISLHGHSIGSVQVQYYAANNWDPDLTAVILTGMFGNLPWKSRHLLIQNEDSYAQLQQAALTALRAGKDSAVLPMGMRRTLGHTEPVTGRHFLTYRAEESSTADSTYWIRRIPRPILMVRDEGDTIIQSFEPTMLLAAATAHGSLVPHIKFVSLPNPQGPNPKGHSFADTQEPLANTIVAWLKERKL